MEADIRKLKAENQSTWDLFISHATEDKTSVVKPLADALVSFGLRVWYDEFTLRPGDSLSRSVDKGLALSNYGVVVLSPAFFAKQWPEYELRGLTAREMAGGKVIVPIWHNVDRDQVLHFSPPLADKLAIMSAGRSSTDLAHAIIEVTNPELFQKIHRRLKFLASIEKARITKIPLEQIKSGPVRHKHLPDELIGRIRFIRAALLGIDTHSMKCWLDGFQRDSHPSREVSIWERICAVIWEYAAMVHLTRQQFSSLFGVVIGVANGANKKELSKHLKFLPSNAFKVIVELMKHNVPVYDVQDSCGFDSEAESNASGIFEDRELFPTDLPNERLKDLIREQKQKTKLQ